jgi:lysozyme family protein
MRKFDRLNLLPEYTKLWASAKVRPAKAAITASVCKDLLKNKVRYQQVAANFKMPWMVVAAIHSLETGRRFDRHLHNGDPLTRRTTHVPAGRPKLGKPPFSWELSAKDVLTMQGALQMPKWDIANCLLFLEDYNGWGYRMRHPTVLSPYLWSMTNHYTRGKYVADGKWNSSAISAQVGAAAILKGLITLEGALS